MQGLALGNPCPQQALSLLPLAPGKDPHAESCPPCSQCARPLEPIGRACPGSAPPPGKEAPWELTQGSSAVSLGAGHRAGTREVSPTQERELLESVVLTARRLEGQVGRTTSLRAEHVPSPWALCWRGGSYNHFCSSQETPSCVLFTNVSQTPHVGICSPVSLSSGAILRTGGCSEASPLPIPTLTPGLTPEIAPDIA